MARYTLEQILASEPQIDPAKIDATTEEDIRRHMIEDGEDPDAEQPTSWQRVVPPKLVREKLGMSREEFAEALRVPVATLQDWEKRRVRDPAVNSLLPTTSGVPDSPWGWVQRRRPLTRAVPRRHAIIPA